MRYVFSLILFVSSIVYSYIAFELDFISEGIPGSGFLPGITGISLILLTGYNLFKEFKNKSKDNYKKSNLIDMLKLIILGFLYVFFFNILGALVSTLLFTIITLIIFNSKKWKQNILISVSVTLVVFLMFDYLLNTNLPIGIFEFIS